VAQTDRCPPAVPNVPRSDIEASVQQECLSLEGRPGLFFGEMVGHQRSSGSGRTELFFAVDYDVPQGRDNTLVDSFSSSAQDRLEGHPLDVFSAAQLQVLVEVPSARAPQILIKGGAASEEVCLRLVESFGEVRQIGLSSLQHCCGVGLVRSPEHRLPGSIVGLPLRADWGERTRPSRPETDDVKAEQQEQ
jgi:hypothetical protein